MHLHSRSMYALGAVLALLLGIVFLHDTTDSFPEARSIGLDVLSFEELSERFRALAQKKGGEYAYEVLRRASLPPQTDLHLLGHAVGEELYGQKGIDGIRLCTPDFRNACSHSIVIGVLAEFGEGALPDIRAACQKAPGGSGAYTMCFHGLGHGVLAGYGYELEPTIQFCERTGTNAYQHREYIECFGGAVMELVGGGGHDRALWEKARERYLRERTPTSVCTSPLVPDALRPICLTYITPYIWEQAGITLGDPQKEKFKDAFLACEALPSGRRDLRQACYGGFGKEFVPIAGARDIRDIGSYTDTHFRDAVLWCTYAQETDGVSWCITEGLNSVFWGGENDPDASFRYCSVVAEVAGSEYKDACDIQLAQNISFYIEGSERAQLCDRIPSVHQLLCAGSGSL